MGETEFARAERLSREVFFLKEKLRIAIEALEYYRDGAPEMMGEPPMNGWVQTIPDGIGLMAKSAIERIGNKT